MPAVSYRPPTPVPPLAFFDVAYCAIVATNSDRNDRLGRVDLLEMKTWVPRVDDKHVVRRTRLLAEFLRKSSELLPERRRRSRFHNFLGSSGSVRPSR